MSTLSNRLQLVLPDDGGVGGDDIVDVTLQISDNFAKLDSAVGLTEVANAGARPGTNLFIGKLIRQTDNGTIYRYTGAAWVTVLDTLVQSDTAATITTNGGTITGVSFYRRWHVVGKMCHFYMRLTINAGASATGTEIIFPLPVGPSNIHANATIGNFTFFKASNTARVFGWVENPTLAQAICRYLTANNLSTGTNGLNPSASQPAAYAGGDFVELWGSYEIA